MSRNHINSDVINTLATFVHDLHMGDLSRQVIDQALRVYSRHPGDHVAGAALSPKLGP